MATLAQRITDLAARVRLKFNAIAPRLLPAGGALGQVLRKASASDYDVAWGNDWTYVKLASDFSTTGTAAVASPLAFTPVAGKTYSVQGLLLLRTNLTGAGARPGVAFPTGLTDQVAQVIVADDVNSAFIANNNGASAVQVAVTGHPNTTTSWFGRVEALLVVGASPSGTFRVTLSTETAGRTATLKAGSYIRWREI